MVFNNLQGIWKKLCSRVAGVGRKLVATASYFINRWFAGLLKKIKIKKKISNCIET